MTEESVINFYALYTLINWTHTGEPVGFINGYGTCDHLHTLKILTEKAKEYNLPLCLAFVDYEKALDSV